MVVSDIKFVGWSEKETFTQGSGVISINAVIYEDTNFSINNINKL